MDTMPDHAAILRYLDIVELALRLQQDDHGRRTVSLLHTLGIDERLLIPVWPPEQAGKHPTHDDH